MFGYRVADPERYGVVDFDAPGQVRAIIEKPDGAAVELCGDRALLSGRHARRTARHRCNPRRAASWKSPICWSCIVPKAA